MEVGKAAGRSMLVVVWTALGVAAAPGQDARAPEERVSEEACGRLQKVLVDAWVAGAREFANADDRARETGEAPSGSGEADTIAQFTSVFDDYLAVCPCETLETNHRRRRNEFGGWWTDAVINMPDEMWARHQATYDERCARRPVRKIAIGAGSAVAAAVAFAALSGGDDGAPASGPSTPPSNSSPPPAGLNPSGTWECGFRFVSGDSRLAGFGGLRSTLRLLFALQVATLIVSGQPGDNFFPLMGPFDLANRLASLTGTGPLAGIPDVGARLDLRFPQDNMADATYVLGTAGRLPGGTATTYAGTCVRQ